MSLNSFAIQTCLLLSMLWAATYAARVKLGAYRKLESNASNQQFDHTLARFFARLASVSFCDHQSIKDWSCGEPCTNAGFVPANVRVIQGGAYSGAQAFVVLLPNSTRVLPYSSERRSRCIVSFRGPRYFVDSRNKMTEFGGVEESRWCPGCKFDSALLAAYRELRAHLWAALLGPLQCEEVHIVGHTSGAGVATIAAADLRGSREMQEAGIVVPPAWLFGAPRVGNMAFSEAFAEITAPAYHPGAWRIIYDEYQVRGHHWQAYEPVGGAVYFSSTGVSNVCEHPHDRNCDRKGMRVAPFEFGEQEESHGHYFGIRFDHYGIPWQCRAFSEDDSSHSIPSVREILTVAEIDTWDHMFLML